MKDCWDKFEIFGKVLLPVVVAIAALFLNNQVSQRNLTGTKLQIAVGVLTGEPKDDTKALRDWAINVLQHPDRDHSLSEEAALELRKQALPNRLREISNWGGFGYADLFQSLECQDKEAEGYNETLCSHYRDWQSPQPWLIIPRE
ncbi:hypothetical protein BFP76_00425 [Amylibacter kogurei]|uniref:Uncharacterized protein n=1 Tax=Paramylibacter kogurei TaxID=1889778 RepID=A0A2G5K7X4_9RHOB|nr:hypothetical protein [Amylibacter kogurei]PIB25637.1 hypothetical protein BFP76_00425 [Amylibacter kogurei]